MSPTQLAKLLQLLGKGAKLQRSPNIPAVAYTLRNGKQAEMSADRYAKYVGALAKRKRDLEGDKPMLLALQEKGLSERSAKRPIPNWKKAPLTWIKNPTKYQQGEHEAAQKKMDKAWETNSRSKVGRSEKNRNTIRGLDRVVGQAKEDENKRPLLKWMVKKELQGPRTRKNTAAPVIPEGRKRVEGGEPMAWAGLKSGEAPIELIKRVVGESRDPKQWLQRLDRVFEKGSNTPIEEKVALVQALVGVKGVESLPIQEYAPKMAEFLEWGIENNVKSMSNAGGGYKGKMVAGMIARPAAKALRQGHQIRPETTVREAVLNNKALGTLASGRGKADALRNERKPETAKAYYDLERRAIPTEEEGNLEDNVVVRRKLPGKEQEAGVEQFLRGTSVGQGRAAKMREPVDRPKPNEGGAEDFEETLTSMIAEREGQEALTLKAGRDAEVEGALSKNPMRNSSVPGAKAMVHLKVGPKPGTKGNKPGTMAEVERGATGAAANRSQSLKQLQQREAFLRDRIEKRAAWLQQAEDTRADYDSDRTGTIRTALAAVKETRDELERVQQKMRELRTVQPKADRALDLIRLIQQSKLR